MVLNIYTIRKSDQYLVASIICLLSFGILGLLISPKSIVNDSFIAKSDYALFLNIVNTHSQVFDHIMIYLTTYGKEVFWTMVIAFLFVAGKKDGKRTALFIVLVMITLIPIGALTKQIIERPRPIIPDSAFLIAANSEYSFPSGHALAVSAGAAMSLVFFRKSSKELFISLLLVTEACLVCFSRVYVGGHYPLDVIGGILLGVGISFLFVWRENDLNQLFSLLSRTIGRFVKR